MLHLLTLKQNQRQERSHNWGLNKNRERNKNLGQHPTQAKGLNQRHIQQQHLWTVVRAVSQKLTQRQSGHRERKFRPHWHSVCWLLLGSLSASPALASSGPGPDWQQIDLNWQQFERNLYPDSDRGVALQATTQLSPQLLVRGALEQQRFDEFADERLRFTAYRIQLGTRMALNPHTDLYGLAGPLFWSRRWSGEEDSFQRQDTGFAGELGLRMAVNPQLDIGAALHHENIDSFSDTFPAVRLRYQFMPNLGLHLGALFPGAGNRYQLGFTWSY